jgi:hypothetical protein
MLVMLLGLEAARATSTPGKESPKAALDDIKTTRGNTLFRFEQGLSALNARRQRAARVNAPDIACRFLVSDMLDIDQSETSATIRADASAVSLKERSRSSKASIRSLTFSSNTGTIEQFNKMYRVHTDDGQTPVGTFQIELVDYVDISLLVFDIVTLPSDPGIRVFASTNGIDKIAALDISRSGYRVNSWIP